jgi:hypothetical protein
MLEATLAAGIEELDINAAAPVARQAGRARFPAVAA